MGCGGLDGILLDGCILRGGQTCISTDNAEWLTISDSIILNYWNYGIFGNAVNMVQNALVVAQPSDYEGTNRDVGSAISPNRQGLNTIKTDQPTIPATNDISHAAQRYGTITSLAMYKCGQYVYGGHGSTHQPGLRLGTNGNLIFEQCQVYQHGCFYAGGNMVMQITTLGSQSGNIPRTPKAWVMDQCRLMGIYCNRGYFVSLVTNMGIRNCRVGHPAGITMATGNLDIEFLIFNDKSEVDYSTSPDGPTALPSFVENCLFEFGADGNSSGSILDFDTDIRGIPITYSGNTFDIDETKVASVASFR
jgi:hypothetical protein